MGTQDGVVENRVEVVQNAQNIHKIQESLFWVCAPKQGLEQTPACQHSWRRDSQQPHRVKCPSVCEWMKGERVVPPYKGMSPSLKKEGTSDTCCNVDEPRGHYARERSQTPEEDSHWVILSQEDLESTFMGGGTGTGLKEGGKVSVWWGRGFSPGRGSILGMDGVMGAQPRKRLYLTPLNQALKTGADGKLHVTYICHS